MRVPIGIFLCGSAVFLVLGFNMSDIGHATGCFLGALVFAIGAGYMHFK
jgi:hypothetical protein